MPWPRISPTLFVTTLLLLLPALSLAAAPEEPTPAEIVERILELQREIDDLLARLPPDLREEVEKKLAEPPPLKGAEPEPAAAPEPPAAEPPAAEPPAAEPAPSPPPPSRRFGRRRAACNTLEAFDTNGDGTVNALDRYFRYLYLWIDRDGDGGMDKREIVTTFDRKVNEISAGLESFASDRLGHGEIRILEHIELDLRGDGFDSGRTRDDAVLLVDATSLQRGDGPRLLSSSGEPIEGIQPFERGWRLEDAEGNVTRLDCP